MDRYRALAMTAVGFLVVALIAALGVWWSQRDRTAQPAVSAVVPTVEAPATAAGAITRATDAGAPAAEGTAIPTPVPTPENDHVPPVVQFLWPPDGATLNLNETAFIMALASDGDGVASIDTVVDGTLFNEGRGNPAVDPLHESLRLNTRWTPDTPGRHVVAVLAYDRVGNVSPTVSRTFEVVDRRDPPRIQLLRPSGETTATVGEMVVVEGFATDLVGISRVELRVNGVLYTDIPSRELLGERLFEVYLAWLPTAPGDYTLVARAVSTGGQTTDAPPVRVTVSDPDAPVVSLGTDLAVAPVRHQVNLRVNASDDTGVVKVELIRDGAVEATWTSVAQQGQVNAFPAFPWQAATPGKRTFEARAYDRSGKVSRSAAVTVDIREAGAAAATPVRPTVAATVAPAPTPTRASIPDVKMSSHQKGFQVSYPDDFPLQLQVETRSNAQLISLEVLGILPPFAPNLMPRILLVKPMSGTSFSGTVEVPAPPDWVPASGDAILLVRVRDAAHTWGATEIRQGRVNLKAP